jgi:hypothetical protein
MHRKENMEIPVNVTVAVHGIVQYTRERVPIHQSSEILEYRTMSEKSGQITFMTGMTLPEVYGTFSSHQVQIGLTVPATEEEVENFEKTLEPYLDRAMIYSRRVLNAVLVSLGKPEKFNLPKLEDGQEES